MSVLDQNLALLVRRAYRPVRPSERARAAIELALARELEATAHGTGRELGAIAPATARDPARERERIARGPFRRAPMDLGGVGRLLPLAAGVAALAAAAWLGARVLRDGAAPVPNDPEIADASADRSGRAPERPQPNSSGSNGATGAAPSADRNAVASASPGDPREPGEAPEPPAASLRVRGIVRDAATGEPLASPLVFALPRRGPFDVSMPIPADAPEPGGPAGAFAFSGLAPERHSLFASAEGYAVAELELKLDLRTPELELVLARGGTVRGLVRDEATGQPLDGAWVFAGRDAPISILPLWLADPDREANEFGLRLVRTGPDGRFALEHVSAGRHELRAIHPERAGAISAAIEVPELGEVADIDIALGLGGGVRGSVRDAFGAPLVGERVVVSAMEFRADGRMSFATAVTDDRGRYEVPHLPPQAYVALWIGPEDAGPDEAPRAIRPLRVVAGETIELDFAAPAAAPATAAGSGALGGRLLGPRGSPVGALAVSIVPKGKYDETSWRTVSAADDGSFAFTDLAPGAYDLAVGPRANGAIVMLESVELGPGERVDRDFHLDGGSLSGTVLDAATREPVERAVLILLSADAAGAADAWSFAGRTFGAGDGSFSFEWLRAGRYRAIAFDSTGRLAFASSECAVAAAPEQNSPQLELRLGPGAALTVSVLDPRGEPVAGADVHFELEGAPIDVAQDQRTDPAGRYEARGLPPGHYRARATLGGRESDVAEIDLAAGDDAAARLTLERKP